MEIDTLTDSISLFPGLSFNAVEEGGLELGIAWFTVIGGLGGGAALGVVDLAIFFFAKKPGTETTFFLVVLKGEAWSHRVFQLMMPVLLLSD